MKYIRYSIKFALETQTTMITSFQGLWSTDIKKILEAFNLCCRPQTSGKLLIQHSFLRFDERLRVISFESDVSNSSYFDGVFMRNDIECIYLISNVSKWNSLENIVILYSLWLWYFWLTKMCWWLFHDLKSTPCYSCIL